MSLLVSGLSARIKGFPNRKPPILLPFSPSLAAPEWKWFWDSCIWAVIPGGSRNNELISGAAGTLVDPGLSNWNGVTEGGMGLESLDSFDGGAYWPQNSIVNTKLTRNFTMISYSELNLSQTWRVLINIPWDSTTFGDPWGHLMFQRGSSGVNGQGVLRYTDSGANGYLIASDNGYMPSGQNPLTLYSVTRNEATGVFYLDGVQYGSSKTFGTNVDIGFNQDNPVNVFQAHEVDQVWSQTDGINLYSAILNIGATAAQMQQLGRDPFGPFRTESRPLFLPSDAPDNIEIAPMLSPTARFDRRVRIY